MAPTVTAANTLQVYRPVGNSWVSSNGGSYTPTFLNRTGRITKVRGAADGVVIAPDGFVLGTTQPFLADPTNPTPTDNVGWDGTPLTVMNGDQTVPANTTWTNRLINGYVTMTDSTSRLVNCYLAGRAKGGVFKFGVVNGTNGGYLERCTIRPSAATLAWTSSSGVAQPAFLNGVQVGGGSWTVTRCDISLVTDAWRKSGTGNILFQGNQVHDFCFWDTDPDQAGTSFHPGWNHADSGGQVTSGVGGDSIIGNSLQCYFDTTGVQWTGGSPGSGTAFGGTYGTPSTALNQGFVNLTTGKGTWGNGITYSNNGGNTGIYIGFNWIDGVNSPSGMIQFTTGTGSAFKMEGNRFGLGGYRPAGGRTYLVSFPAGTSCDYQSGALNVYDNLPSVPSSLRGLPIPYNGSTNFNVVPSNYT